MTHSTCLGPSPTLLSIHPSSLVHIRVEAEHYSAIHPNGTYLLPLTAEGCIYDGPEFDSWVSPAFAGLHNLPRIAVLSRGLPLSVTTSYLLRTAFSTLGVLELAKLSAVHSIFQAQAHWICMWILKCRCAKETKALNVFQPVASCVPPDST